MDIVKRSAFVDLFEDFGDCPPESRNWSDVTASVTLSRPSLALRV